MRITIVIDFILEALSTVIEIFADSKLNKFLSKRAEKKAAGKPAEEREKERAAE